MIAPVTAFCSLAKTLPRGDPGSVAEPVAGSMSALSLFKQACLTRELMPRQKSAPEAKYPVARSCGTEKLTLAVRSRMLLGGGRFRPGGFVVPIGRLGSCWS